MLFFKQKTAYDVRISDWSSDVCSSDLSTYYAAAQADVEVMDPMGSVSLEGFSAYNNYFKDGLDKLGVDVQVFSVGDYKTAVEQFTRNDMSPDALAADIERLGDLRHAYSAGVGHGHKLTENKHRESVERGES